jgi:hypothetical protein
MKKKSWISLDISKVLKLGHNPSLIIMAWVFVQSPFTNALGSKRLNVTLAKKHLFFVL